MSHRKPTQWRKIRQFSSGLKWHVLVATAWVLASCANGGSSDGNLFRIPWPDNSGNYHLQNISIRSYDHPESLSGHYVSVFVNPRYNDGQMATDSPRGRYSRTSAGVAVPSDDSTLQATAINAHFERLVDIDQQLGLTLRQGYTVPFRVAIKANITNSDDGAVMSNNALFIRDLDALMIVPFSSSELPIAVNAGILAHEHFHMIFQELVLDQLPDGGKIKQSGLTVAHCDWNVSPSAAPDTAATSTASAAAASEQDEDHISRYNAFYLRAINEGMADFWGWAYTGDAKFLAKSLSSISQSRRLDKAVGTMKGTNVVDALYVTGTRTGQVISDAMMFSSAYTLGTEYARALYMLSGDLSDGDMSTPEKRMAAAKLLVQALPDLAKSVLEAESAGKMISPNALFTALWDHWPKDKSSAVACLHFQRLAAPEPHSVFVSHLGCQADPSASPTPAAAAAGGATR